MTETTAPGWQPKVERRAHPFGEAGVSSSLEEVCKKASEGALHPKVRLWAVECLERARRERGLKVKTESERAEILLKAVQGKLWVPDPVGSEWIAGAHLMACDRHDKDAPCFHAGDCDDLASLLGACFMSVGLYTMIVGHGYHGRGNISHVLCAVRVGGRWLYADPSTDLPLGECVSFTREKLLSVPNIKVLCDKPRCLTFPTLFDPDKNGFIEKGDFVGVNGPDGEPLFRWIEGPEEEIRWLGQEKSAEQKTYEATLQEAENRDFGTSKEDMEAYGAVAGGTAAAAVCGATGALAVVAAGCATVGAGLGGIIGGKLYDWGESVFNPDADEWRKYEERKAYVQALFQAEKVVWDWRSKMIEDLDKAAADVVLLRRSMRPEAEWTLTDGIVELGQHGLELTRLPNTLQLYPPNIIEKWYKTEQLYGLQKAGEIVGADVVDWYEQLRESSLRVALDIASEEAVEEAEKEVKLNLSRLPQVQQPPKKSRVVPVVIGTAVAGGLGFLAYKAFA